MMQELLNLVRAGAISWGYAVTLGWIYAARLGWLAPSLHSTSYASRLYESVGTAVFASPFIVLTASLFALIVAPLAAWSMGSASWSAEKRYIYGFWSVLALYCVVRGNADGLILLSGAGLIALWFLSNPELLVRSRDNLGTPAPLRIARYRRGLMVLAGLAAVTSVWGLYAFSGAGERKVYVAEILAIYVIACICQGAKTFRLMEQARTVNAGVEQT